MFRYFIIFVILAVSALLFFTFTDPLYKNVKIIKNQVSQLNEALNDSKKIQEIRGALLDRFNALSSDDLQRIQKALPDHIDNVRLILEINRIASEQGLILKDVRVSEEEQKEGVFGPDERKFGTTGLDINIIGSYSAFVNFVINLEKSLRILEITSLSFTSTSQGINTYSINLETYWLK